MHLPEPVWHQIREYLLGGDASQRCRCRISDDLLIACLQCSTEFKGVKLHWADCAAGAQCPYCPCCGAPGELLLAIGRKERQLRSLGAVSRYRLI